MRVIGEDVEDDRGAVDHRHPQRRLEIALLARRQLVVAGDEVRVGSRELGLQLLELAGAQVGIRMRVLAPLHHLPHDRRARGAQQLPELDELLLALVGEHRDRERALTSAAAVRATVR